MLLFIGLFFRKMIKLHENKKPTFQLNPDTSGAIFCQFLFYRIGKGRYLANSDPKIAHFKSVVDVLYR